MRRRRLIGLLVGCCLAAVLAVLTLSGEHEPRYRGKSLGQWLTIDHQARARAPFWEVMDSMQPRRFPYVADPLVSAWPLAPEAEEAVRHMGTNALPWLIKWIDGEPSPLRCNLYTQFSGLPPKLQARLIRRVLAPPDPPLRQLASTGFSVLGTNASPAIPDLVRLIHQSKPGSPTRECAISCFAFIGSAACLALADLVNDPEPRTSQQAWEIYKLMCLRRGWMDSPQQRLPGPNPPYYLQRPEEQGRH